MLNSAKRPVILGGVEIHRFGLQQSLLRLVERSGYPIATTLLGKSIITERHPRHIGIYEGAMGSDYARRMVEKSDCVLILGAFLTDIDLGIFTAHLDVSRIINANSERIAIRYHNFDYIVLRDFIEGLAKNIKARQRPFPAVPRPQVKPFWAQTHKQIKVSRFFERMNTFLEDDSLVICDIGDCLFGAADLTIHRRTEFLSPAYYTSMGFAVPAALGAQIGKSHLRPVVFVGDGAFQMTGQELSAIVRYGLNPVIFVLNNKGYTTERLIKDGPYNDILDWKYHLWPDIVQSGWGCEVRTEGELEEALTRARKNTGSFSIINVHLDPFDHSHSLERLGKRLSRKVR
jgi:indolepyruvate decarboxylase